MRLLKAGLLDSDLVAALVAALLQAPAAGAVAEGARLAMYVDHPRIRQLFPAALDAQDIGQLLHADPVMKGRSVEDALLTAWAHLAPLHEPAVRAPMLERLSNAGLVEVEARVLATFSDGDEIRVLLPVIFLEGVPDGVPQALLPVLQRPIPVKAVAAVVLRGLPQRMQKTLVDRAPQLAALL